MSDLPNQNLRVVRARQHNLKNLHLEIPRGRLVVVSLPERGENIRIISARVATPRERKNHEENPLGGWSHE